MSGAGRSRRRRGGAVAWRFLLCIAALPVADGAAIGFTKSPRSKQVDLKLRTGGALRGTIVEFSSHGLIVLHDDQPHVFAWSELESGSAFVTRRELLIRWRGGPDRLTAEDHFRLGRFALAQERPDLAARCFGAAGRMDTRYRSRARSAVEAYTEAREELGAGGDPFAPHDHDGDDGGVGDVAIDDAKPSVPAPAEPPSDRATPAIDAALSGASSELRSRVMEVYRTFGDKAREMFGDSVVAIESPHFLIWTDWESRHRDRLDDWCEAAYAALVGQFELDPSVPVFLAKCPVFCFRSRARFIRFARTFDGFEGTGAVGYTRSIEQTGHVHVVLLRQGRSSIDLDRFAATLVHETTHAFVHRLYAHRLIPHWVNEGLADRMAERVLGDRCPNAENAALLAAWYDRENRPIASLLESTGPIAVEQYPLAHSVVSFLCELDPEGFTAFLRRLKSGERAGDALPAAMDGLTLDQLERRWRAWVALRTTLDELERVAGVPGDRPSATVRPQSE